MFNLTEYVSLQAAVWSNNTFTARSVIIFLVNILDPEHS